MLATRACEGSRGTRSSYHRSPRSWMLPGGNPGPMLAVLMSNRVFNFSAGPGTLPAEVLEAAAQSLVDYQGKGFGIAECSHRGKEFDAVLDEAIDRCRKLLSIPETHDVLF